MLLQIANIALWCLRSWVRDKYSAAVCRRWKTRLKHSHQRIDTRTSKHCLIANTETIENNSATTQAPMSLYPNILDISAYNAMVVPHPYPQQIRTKNDYQHPQRHFDHHYLSEGVVGFFSHMFAPASYLQCTSSIPSWSPPSRDEQPTNPKFIVDDDMVLQGAEEDGGPLCREATIASWKARAVQKERRRSLQWLAAVFRKEGAQ